MKKVESVHIFSNRIDKKHYDGIHRKTWRD